MNIKRGAIAWVALWALTRASGVYACTCEGTRSFEQAAAEAPLVAEVRVTRASFRSEAELDAYENSIEQWRRAADATKVPFPSVANRIFNPEVELQRVLKGASPPSRLRIIDPLMCYMSVSPSSMFVDAVYVIALYPISESGRGTNGDIDPSEAIFGISMCSENALVREGDSLYTYEGNESNNYRPTKRLHGKYDDFVRTLESTAKTPQ